jgi:hypothetical protein
MKSFKQYLLEITTGNPAVTLYGTDPPPESVERGGKVFPIHGSLRRGLDASAKFYDALDKLGIVPKSLNIHDLARVMRIAQDKILTGNHDHEPYRNLTVPQRMVMGRELHDHLVNHIAGTAQGLSAISDLHGMGHEPTVPNLLRVMPPPPSKNIDLA